MTTQPEADKVALTARNVSWDWTGLPMHYFDANPFATHLANGMNMLLPEGEVFFVEVFQKALPLIKDDAVRADVIGFIGQEATHSSSHQSLLEHLKAQGLDTDPYVAQIQWMFRRLLGDRELTGRKAHSWLLERVAVVAALEHFTSYLGDWGLNARAGTMPSTRRCSTCSAGTWPRRSNTGTWRSTCSPTSTAATRAGCAHG